MPTDRHRVRVDVDELEELFEQRSAGGRLREARSLEGAPRPVSRRAAGRMRLRMVGRAGAEPVDDRVLAPPLGLLDPVERGAVEGPS